MKLFEVASFHLKSPEVPPKGLRRAPPHVYYILLKENSKDPSHISRKLIFKIIPGKGFC